MSLKLTFKMITEDNPYFQDAKLPKPYNVRGTMTDINRPQVDTMTGMRSYMIDEVAEWVKENNCGVQYDEYDNKSLTPAFGFDTEEELALFLLRWG